MTVAEADKSLYLIPYHYFVNLKFRNLNVLELEVVKNVTRKLK